MDVSIVITNYNQNKFLISLLKYLYNSVKYFHPYSVEIIVIDNFSSGSEELKEIYYAEFLHQYFSIKTSFVFLDKNFGPSYSRNKGAEISHGKYIQLIDADDWISSNKISMQYEFAIKNNYPSFVTSQWSRVTAESDWNSRQEISIHQPYFSGNIPINLIKNDGFIHLMSGLIKQESFLKSGGFKEDMWLVEDIRFLIDLYQVESHFAICPSEQALFFYRVGQTHSLSNSRPLEFCNACYANAVYLENLLQSMGYICNESDRQVFLEVYGQLARFYFEHDRLKFYEVLAKLRNLNPNYLPATPKALRHLAKWFGYEQAEAIALNYRRLKYLFQHFCLK